jgi:mannose-6-phosphate isomerase-like protein (cupin superfamily)
MSTSVAAAAPPFAVQPGEGRAMQTPTGDTVVVKADTRMTNGSLTVLELVIGPKSGPALHTHLREDELWYVLEGEFRFTAAGVPLRASAGGMAFGPRGMPHAFQNVGDTPGRLLIVTTPSGVERFLSSGQSPGRTREIRTASAPWGRRTGWTSPVRR